MISWDSSTKAAMGGKGYRKLEIYAPILNSGSFKVP